MNNIHQKNVLDMAVFHKIDINLYPLFISIFEQKSISKIKYFHKLNTSFYGNENLSLDINKFIFLYNFNIEKELPYGTYMIVLSQLSANISSKNNIREIFQTSDNFLNIKIDFSKEILSLNILMDIITINLSYRDLLSFLRVYSLNMKTYKIGLEKREEYLKNLKLNEKI